MMIKKGGSEAIFGVEMKKRKCIGSKQIRKLKFQIFYRLQGAQNTDATSPRAL